MAIGVMATGMLTSTLRVLATAFQHIGGYHPELPQKSKPMSDEFNPDWKLSPIDSAAVKLSLALHRHVPNWPGATDEQIAAIVKEMYEVTGIADVIRSSEPPTKSNWREHDVCSLRK